MRFLAVFLAITTALFSTELTPFGQRFVVEPWTEGVARGAAAALGAFDPSVIASGRSLLDRSTGSGVSIEAGCNGVEAMILIVAAMVAFRASWKQRAIGLAAGFVAVQTLNLVRIVSLYYLARWDFAIFEWVHLYLWQALIMIDVVLVWIVWLRWISRKSNAHTA